jgi:lipid II:glycine glycyltransferase (peptidoglycan interpeptide bridge formation enzyme)
MLMTENSTDWDNLQRKLGASFLQSYQWGEFQRALNHQVHMLYGDNWSCLLVEKKTPLGTYLFAPYGPTLSTAADLKPALEEIISYATSKKIDWLRIEPLCSGQSIDPKVLQKLGAKAAPKDVNPRFTRVIDLRPSEEEIFTDLKSTNRNLIRRAQREAPLSYKMSSDPNDIELFIPMMEAVSTRNSVNFHTPGYYRKQATTLMPSGIMQLCFALDKKPLAALVIHDYGVNSTYTYAGSLKEAREKDASMLLLWQAILAAKKRGQQSFDLFGIAPEDSTKDHPWYGLSEFKRKFGGKIVERSGTWDIPLHKLKYQSYRSVSKTRKSAKKFFKF